MFSQFPLLCVTVGIW